MVAIVTRLKELVSKEAEKRTLFGSPGFFFFSAKTLNIDCSSMLYSTVVMETLAGLSSFFPSQVVLLML